jgi:hypothetical protein
MLGGKCETKETGNFERTQLVFSSRQRARTHVPETQRVCEFVPNNNNNNMIIVPHPPYSLDLAPRHFALLNGRFETLFDIQSKQHVIL